MNLLIYSWICLQTILPMTDSNKSSDSQQWDSFKVQYNKNYAIDDEIKKKKIYADNLDKIAKHNARFNRGEASYEMGMNEFGDLTAEEFAEIYLSKPTGPGGSKPQVTDNDPQFNVIIPKDSGPAPKSKNWVNAMTSVKTQGQCGCCWDFAVVGAIEGHVFIKTQKKISLSEQNILDCLRNRYGRENSCEIGAALDALRYVVDNGGIQSENTYPYTGQGDTCDYDPHKKAASIADFKRLKHDDEELMRNVVGHIGPLVCAFDSEADFVQFYKSGIYDSDTCAKSMESMNHFLVLVGYGTDVGLDYWLAKNSWGPGWGEQGYVRIRRGGNVCGIASDTYYPVV